MTTTQQTKLARVKAWLTERIAEAEKATAGPWAVHPSVAQVDAFTPHPVPVCQLLWPTELRTEAETEANAAFIATSRTAAPIAYRGLLVSIEGLEKIAKPALGGKQQQWEAQETLTSIINLFPDDL
jgi:hypothetical protein